MASSAPLLSATSVAKSYNGVPALSDANLVVEPGEIHALMGENGAGKSTLIKILAGVVKPDTATVAVDGHTVHIDSAKTAYRLGLRFIHQEFNVVHTLSVAENIFIGRRYPRRAGVLVDWTDLNRQAQRVLHRLGIDHIEPHQNLGELSLGDQMLVRISAALLDDARLYVMDEPTAALTREESERLFRVLREVRASGSSVLYVSHRIDEIMALCDRATVLRDGRSIDSGAMADITHDHLVSLMIGRKVDEAFPKAMAQPRSRSIFEAKDLQSKHLTGASFSVREGEVFGIAGLAGAGQGDLLRTIFGDSPLASGVMTLGDRAYRPTSPQSAWRRGVAYVPRERRAEGLLMRRPIYENVTLAHLRRHSLAGAWLLPRQEKQFAATLGASMRLKASGPAQDVLELSGGNQQKVLFAKAVSGNPRLLLLEEPTRGVDIGAKFDLYSIIRELTAKGAAVIVVSSDLPELIGISDRIAIMRNGALDAIVDASGLSEADLVNLCYGRAPGMVA